MVVCFVFIFLILFDILHQYLGMCGLFSVEDTNSEWVKVSGYTGLLGRLTFNPVNPHSASKHHFPSLKMDFTWLISYT